MPPARARPLSPHLQIYRWQIGSTLSILHRITGLLLAAGLLALIFWFASLAGDEAGYRGAVRLFASPLGLLILVGWTFAFFYHLLNGLRHLFWDIGRGFGRTERRVSGWLAAAGACALTLGVWSLLWHFERL
jgi:succinate dehydrogenase / fumarate reductase cytochrome b subunit